MREQFRYLNLYALYTITVSAAPDVIPDAATTATDTLTATTGFVTRNPLSVLPEVTDVFASSSDGIATTLYMVTQSISSATVATTPSATMATFETTSSASASTIQLPTSLAPVSDVSSVDTREVVTANTVVNLVKSTVVSSTDAAIKPVDALSPGIDLIVPTSDIPVTSASDVDAPATDGIAPSLDMVVTVKTVAETVTTNILPPTIATPLLTSDPLQAPVLDATSQPDAETDSKPPSKDAKNSEVPLIETNEEKTATNMGKKDKDAPASKPSSEVGENSEVPLIETKEEKTATNLEKKDKDAKAPGTHSNSDIQVYFLLKCKLHNALLNAQSAQSEVCVTQPKLPSEQLAKGLTLLRE